MQEVSGSIPLGSTTSSRRSANAGLFCWVWLVHVGVVDVSFGVVSCRSLIPFVSSEVETPIEVAPSLSGISTSLDANG